MGGYMSSGVDDSLAKNKAINKELQRERVMELKTIRVLLLGAKGSGKSTITKGLRLMHAGSLSSLEIESYRVLVFESVLKGMRELIIAMGDDLNIDVGAENKHYLPLVLNAPYSIKEGDPFPQALLEPLTALWSDSAVKAAYERRNEVPLCDSLFYFLDHLPRLWERDYVPNTDDIVNCRVQMTGVTETLVNAHGNAFRFIDVKGLRGERRKWIHFFQNVTSILFVVDLSGYDQCLAEDHDANQMQHALQVWDAICNSLWFTETVLILFLNKTDLFRQKLEYSPISTFFPDFEGPKGDFAAGKDYFRQRFVRLSNKSNRQLNRDVYTYFTTSTATDLLKFVSIAVEK